MSDPAVTAYSHSMAVRGNVAIVGMACIFPDAPDLNAFWHNIANKVNAVSDVPAERWDPDVFFDSTSEANDRVYSKRGGY